MQSWQAEVYKSQAWKRLRRAVIDRDGGICQLCGKLVAGRADVDHIQEMTKSNYRDAAIAFNPDNLRCVHAECHNQRHGRFTKKSIVTDSLVIDYASRT